MNVPTKVLVVDDDPLLREVLRIQLERWGYTVAEASNGEQALLAAGQMQPQLIFLDIFMPEADGLETLKQLKAQTHQSKIVMISGAGRCSHGCDFLQMGAKLGAHAILHKPFTSAELASALQPLVDAAFPAA